MGESKVMVYVSVGILGVAAAALAFSAEATKVKESDIEVTEFSCNYPSSPANILGYTAAALLLISQITISAVTRCACCQRNTTCSGSAGPIICFVISWIASVIGISLLVSAANLSSYHEHYELTGLCYYVKPGVFAAGGGLAIGACVLGLCAYAASSKSNYPQPTSATQPYNQGGIAMGNPQFNNNTAYPSPYNKQQQFAV